MGGNSCTTNEQVLLLFQITQKHHVCPIPQLLWSVLYINVKLQCCAQCHKEQIFYWSLPHPTVLEVILFKRVNFDSCCIAAAQHHSGSSQIKWDTSLIFAFIEAGHGIRQCDLKDQMPSLWHICLVPMPALYWISTGLRGLGWIFSCGASAENRCLQLERISCAHKAVACY